MKWMYFVFIPSIALGLAVGRPDPIESVAQPPEIVANVTTDARIELTDNRRYPTKSSERYTDRNDNNFTHDVDRLSNTELLNDFLKNSLDDFRTNTFTNYIHINTSVLNFNHTTNDSAAIETKWSDDVNIPIYDNQESTIFVKVKPVGSQNYYEYQYHPTQSSPTTAPQYDLSINEPNQDIFNYGLIDVNYYGTTALPPPPYPEYYPVDPADPDPYLYEYENTINVDEQSYWPNTNKDVPVFVGGPSQQSPPGGGTIPFCPPNTIFTQQGGCTDVRVFVRPNVGVDETIGVHVERPSLQIPHTHIVSTGVAVESEKFPIAPAVAQSGGSGWPAIIPAIIPIVAGGGGGGGGGGFKKKRKKHRKHDQEENSLMYVMELGLTGMLIKFLNVLPYLALLNPLSFIFWFILLPPTVMLLAGGSAILYYMFPMVKSMLLRQTQTRKPETIIIHKDVPLYYSSKYGYHWINPRNDVSVSELAVMDERDRSDKWRQKRQMKSFRQLPFRHYSHYGTVFY